MDTNGILSHLHLQRKRIEQAIAAIERLGEKSPAITSTKGEGSRRRGRRRMSAAARRRLSLLLKQRWASGKMQKRKSRIKP